MTDISLEHEVALLCFKSAMQFFYWIVAFLYVFVMAYRPGKPRLTFSRYSTILGYLAIASLFTSSFYFMGFAFDHSGSIPKVVIFASLYWPIILVAFLNRKRIKRHYTRVAQDIVPIVNLKIRAKAIYGYSDKCIWFHHLLIVANLFLLFFVKSLYGEKAEYIVSNYFLL